MFRAKTLIHLLVSLSLILNGVGTAAAAVVFQVEALVDPQSVAMLAGCHEHDASISSSTPPRQLHADAYAFETDPDAGEGDSGDCCKDGSCGCGCAHHSQLVLAATFLVMPTIAPASIQREQLAAFLSPSLSRPVRPPIA